MTRRITVAILLTVWSLLIAAGIAAYFTTRSVLIQGIDAALVGRALSLPGLSRSTATQIPAVAVTGDRWIVKDQAGRTIDRPATAPSAAGESPLIEAHFSRSPEGELLRTVTVRAVRVDPGDVDQYVPANIIYSGSAKEFELLLIRLAWALATVDLVAGLLAAGVAMRVSRLALRPLRATADQIAAIDEQHLDDRIAVKDLPSELTPMAERLNEMLARLEDSFALRRRFLADASHELRTPVAALMTTLEVSLSRQRDADAYRRTLTTCLEDTTLLRTLVDRLMEQVRSESLTHDESATETNVSHLLTQCANLIEPMASHKTVQLVRDFPPNIIGPTLPIRLRSIVMNLLSNALEYNRPGGRIEIHSSPHDTGFDLRISDTGVGISREDLTHIFEPFFRVDQSREKDAGHLGLGLSTVQSHLSALRGSFQVESEPKVGTIFKIRIPWFRQNQLNGVENGG